MSKPVAQSLNFAFLVDDDPLLDAYAAQAERYVFEDPNAALIKLRQLVEMMAQLVSTHFGWAADGDSRFLDVLRELSRRDVITRDISDAFHHIRKAGNRAVHHHEDSRREAFQCLRLARTIAIWFHRSFSTDGRFKPPAFVPPPNPAEQDAALEAELERLRAELAEARGPDPEIEDALASAEADARAAWTQLAAALELAHETEAQTLAARAAYAERVSALEQSVREEHAGDASAALRAIRLAQRAGEDLELDEAAVRGIVDAQLREAGWRADSGSLRYDAGTRPSDDPEDAVAIAEWPTDAGAADYVLFLGGAPVATLEVKRSALDLEQAVRQATAYARTLHAFDGASFPARWEGARAPFALASNGGPWVPDLASESGLRMRDLRQDGAARPVADWPRPEDLRTRLANAPATRLSRTLTLRPHVAAAVDALFGACASGRRQALARVAAGAGKSFVALATVERALLERPNARVLLLTESSEEAAVGAPDWALEPLLESGRVDVLSLPTLLAQVAADRACSATAYEVVVVDECDPAMLFGSPWERLPTFALAERYAEALLRFDALLLGVTANGDTPPCASFGAPVFDYPLSSAIADGFLVANHPPEVLRFEPERCGGLPLKTARVKDAEGASEGAAPELGAFGAVSVAVDDIGLRVLQPGAELRLAHEIARRFDPWLARDAIVVCANARHAALVAESLNAALVSRFGQVPSDTVVDAVNDVGAGAAAAAECGAGPAGRISVVTQAELGAVSLASVHLLVFASPVRSLGQYIRALSAASRPAQGKSGFDVLHAFARDPLPVVSDPRNTGLPDGLRVDGHKRVLVDGRTFGARTSRVWGRDADAGAHLDAFAALSQARESDAAWAAMRAGTQTRAHVRTVIAELAEARFTTHSLRYAMREVSGEDVALPVAAWVRHFSGDPQTLVAASHAWAKRERAFADTPHWTAAERARLQSLLGALRRDGTLDASTPEVSEAGGVTACECALDLSLDALVRRVSGHG